MPRSILAERLVSIGILALWLPTLLGIAVVILLLDGAPVFVRREHRTVSGREVLGLRFNTRGLAGRRIKNHGLDCLPQYLDVVTGRMALADVDPALPFRPHSSPKF